MIYCTPFNNDTKRATNNSLDSGFPDLAAVRETMGEPHIERPTMLIYGDGVDRVVFAPIVFCIDAKSSTA